MEALVQLISEENSVRFHLLSSKFYLVSFFCLIHTYIDTYIIILAVVRPCGLLKPYELVFVEGGKRSARKKPLKSG